MNRPRPRIDWLVVFVWLALSSIVGLLVLGVLGWALWAVLEIVARVGPWVLDNIVGVFVAVCVVGVAILARLARKDTPLW